MNKTRKKGSFTPTNMSSIRNRNKSSKSNRMNHKENNKSSKSNKMNRKENKSRSKRKLKETTNPKKKMKYSLKSKKPSKNKRKYIKKENKKHEETKKMETKNNDSQTSNFLSNNDIWNMLCDYIGLDFFTICCFLRCNKIVQSNTLTWMQKQTFVEYISRKNSKDFLLHKFVHHLSFYSSCTVLHIRFPDCLSEMFLDCLTSCLRTDEKFLPKLKKLIIPPSSRRFVTKREILTHDIDEDVLFCFVCPSGVINIDEEDNIDILFANRKFMLNHFSRRNDTNTIWTRDGTLKTFFQEDESSTDKKEMNTSLTPKQVLIASVLFESTLDQINNISKDQMTSETCHHFHFVDEFLVRRFDYMEKRMIEAIVSDSKLVETKWVKFIHQRINMYVEHRRKLHTQSDRSMNLICCLNSNRGKDFIAFLNRFHPLLCGVINGTKWIEFLTCLTPTLLDELSEVNDMAFINRSCLFYPDAIDDNDYMGFKRFLAPLLRKILLDSEEQKGNLSKLSMRCDFWSKLLKCDSVVHTRYESDIAHVICHSVIICSGNLCCENQLSLIFQFLGQRKVRVEVILDRLGETLIDLCKMNEKKWVELKLTLLRVWTNWDSLPL
jgi:hypothetical protein